MVKIPFAIKDRPWYPHNRRFTEFEARLDFLILRGIGEDVKDLHTRWRWTLDEAIQFVEIINRTNFLIEDWYLEDESNPKRRVVAQEIINIFNQVFDRKIQLTEPRIRIISARLKEGKKLKPATTKESFKAVFEHMKKEWSDTEMKRHLVIETLCRASHFQKYLEAARLDYINSQKQKSAPAGTVLTEALFKA